MKKIFLQNLIVLTMSSFCVSGCIHQYIAWRLDVPVTLHTGIRSGRVVDAVTGEPIEGAVVVFKWNIIKGVIERQTTIFGPVYETTTDKKGKYFIPSQSIKTKADWYPELDSEDVIVYKFGYVTYKMLNREVCRRMEYLPNLRQKYRRNFNKVKLQPWIDELSHWDNVSSIYSLLELPIADELQLIFGAVTEEASLAEKDRPQKMVDRVRDAGAWRKQMERKRNAYKKNIITREEYISYLGETSSVPILIEILKKRLYRSTFQIPFNILCEQIGRVDLKHSEVIPERKKIVAEIEDWWERNKDKNRLEWFCDYAVNSKNQSVRGNAVKNLGEFGDKAAIPYLIQCLNEKDSDISVHSYVLTALVKIGDKSAIPHIKKRLKHKNIRAQRGAAIALHKLGDDSGVPAMIKLLKSRRWDTREAAENTLSQIIDQDFAKFTPGIGYDTREARKQRIKKWLEWWEKNKHHYEKP